MYFFQVFNVHDRVIHIMVKVYEIRVINIFKKTMNAHLSLVFSLIQPYLDQNRLHYLQNLFAAVQSNYYCAWTNIHPQQPKFLPQGVFFSPR